MIDETKYLLAIDMCYFNSTHLGGKDEVAFNLLMGLEKMGVSKEVICFCSKEMKPIIQKYAPRVHICILPQFKEGKIKKIGRVNFTFRKYYLKYWAKKKEAKVLLFPNKVTPNCRYPLTTIVIPHDIQVFAAKDLPGVEYTEQGYKEGKNCLIRDFKNRDVVVAISQFDKAEMIHYMPWAKEKIKQIYDPIYFEKMGEITARGEDYLTVLNILWPHKNAETVIRAYASIAGLIKESLILVGKVPEKVEELKKLTRDLGVSERVIFTGFVSTEKLEEIVSKTRIYINASYFEGFGMTAVEMMGKGIPTIVANNTAQKEVTKGLCQYYEPTDNYKELAKAILYELEHPTSKEKLKEIAKEIREAYAYDRIAEKYWNLILECAEKEDMD